MNAERLEAIVAAYGARPERWPDAERAAALALIAADPALAKRRHAAAQLDVLLNSDPPPTPHGALVGRILAGAPRRRGAARWWAGLGLATAGLAGVAAGALLLPLAAPLLDRDPAYWTEDQPTLFTPAYAGESWS